MNDVSLFGTRYTSQGAIFDESRAYRYLLWRRWAPVDVSSAKGMVSFVMLNPSTADENILDPTLRRCEAFARLWGHDGFEVVNLFALRSTDPDDMKAHAAPGDTFENDQHIVSSAGNAGLVICGWGNDGGHRGRDAIVVKLLTGVGVRLHCLKVNEKTGKPAHPLYLRGNLQPVPFGVD